jgi:hypothetical protein
MVKPLLQYLTIIFLVFFFSKAFSQFPYKESFTNRTANGVVFGGAPAAFLTASGGSSTGGLPVDSTGAGFLRLTNATNNQKGYAYGLNLNTISMVAPARTVSVSFCLMLLQILL